MSRKEQESFNNKQFIAVVSWLVFNLKERGDHLAAYRLADMYFPKSCWTKPLIERLKREAQVA